MDSKNVIVCNRCVMDTTDPDIIFDEVGNCNHCNSYFNQNLNYSPEKEAQLQVVISQIKKEGENKKYDCIIGVSGGVDSTYVAYEVKKRGLRPLAVHLDNGWNSELAVTNIEKILEKLDIDLFTYVIDWAEFKDLQLSFLKASTPGMEIPTDHAINAILNKLAVKHNIRYIINGSNASSEHIMASSWSEGDGQRDWLLIKNIQKQFGKLKLKSFPHTTLIDNFRYKLVNKIVVVNILNYIDFKKTRAMKVIEEELGWIYYGGKHYESIYTRFTQAYLQPKKFNIDKRKAHHSNLICSGDMTRKEALEDLKKEPYPSEQMLNQDKAFFLKKLDMTDDQFQKMMLNPVKSYLNYEGYFNHKLYKTIYDIAFNIHNKLKEINYYGKRAD